MSRLEAYASIEGGVKAAGEEEEEGCKLVYLLLDSGAKILLPLRFELCIAVLASQCSHHNSSIECFIL